MSEAIDSKHVYWKTQVDWEDLYPRLLLFTERRLRRLSWRGKRSGAIPAGKTANDFVQDAILKTLSEQRIWNRGHSLFDHLAGVISSDISCLVNSAENKRTLQADDEKIIHIADHMEDPETAAIRKSEEQKFFEYLEAKNPALKRLAQLMLYEKHTHSRAARR